MKLDYFDHGEDGMKPVDRLNSRITTTETLRQTVNLDVVDSAFPIERYHQHFDRDSSTMQKVPTDGDVEWKFGLLKEGKETGFRIEQCFHAIEVQLVQNGGRNLKRILREAFGLDNPAISNVEVVKVQEGFQHGIFRVNVLVGEQTYSLAVTVSRDPFFNQDLINDHARMMELRKAEAAKMKLGSRSAAFDNVSNIPEHYHAFLPEDRFSGPAMHFAKFLHAAELNLLFKEGEDGSVQKIVSFNAMNLGGVPQRLDSEVASMVMRKIAFANLKYAVLGNKALCTVMKGGDFMLDPETAKLIWHTFRDPRMVASYLSNENSAYFADVSMRNRPLSGLKMDAFTLQILQLLFAYEPGITSGPNGVAYPVYSDKELFGAVRDMLESKTIGLNVLLNSLNQIREYIRRGDEDFKTLDPKTKELAFARFTNFVSRFAEMEKAVQSPGA